MLPLILVTLLCGKPDLRAQATALYREGAFDQACPLFAKVAQDRPKDAALLADWGLCLQRQGKAAEALTVDRRALAEAGDDEQTRRNVYFNLGELKAADVTPAKLAVTVEANGKFGALSYPEAGEVELPSTSAACRNRKLVARIDAWRCAGDAAVNCDNTVGLRVFVPGAREAGSGCVRAQSLKGSAPCVFWASVGNATSCSPGSATRDHDGCVTEYAPEPGGSCAIVAVDPCGGHVGLFCTIADEADHSAFPARKPIAVELTVTPR